MLGVAGMEDRLVAESRVQATALAGYAAVVTDAAAARALAASLFDSPQVVAAWIDAALCYRCVSRGYASLDDREPAEYPGRRVFELHPDTVMEERFAQVLTTGEPQAGSARSCNNSSVKSFGPL